MRSVEVDGFLGRCLGHFLVVLMDLEAETLSELRSFYALSTYIGFGSLFYKNYGFVCQGRVDVNDFVAEAIN